MKVNNDRGIMNVSYYFSFIGDIEGAKVIVQRCLDNDSTFVNGHLLMAQVFIFVVIFNGTMAVEF